MTHQQTDNTLADAIWWLKGFRAARPDTDTDPSCDLGSDLLSARIWLRRLALGKSRMLGLSDHTRAVVLTEHEFEVIYDALRIEADAAEQQDGRDQIAKVYQEFTAERKDAGKEEGLPF